MKDTYERLRERLDEMATGYPATQSRVEIKILKRLFTEEEAEFFLLFPLSLKTSEYIAKRLSRDPGETATLMERMAKRGLIFKQRKNKTIRYAPVPYIIGIFEFQVNNLSKDLLRDLVYYWRARKGLS